MSIGNIGTRFGVLLFCYLGFYPLLADAGASDHIVSMAMGNTGTALPAGIEAVGLNPALLGLPRESRVEVPFFALGGRAGNNSFGLEDYNRYSGAVLTEADKEDILEGIPESGFRLEADAGLLGPGIAIGPFALTLRGVAASNLILDRRTFELLLYGNGVVEDFSLEDAQGEAWAVAELGLSYARGIKVGKRRVLSLGFTASYLRGLAGFRSRELDARVRTDVSGLHGGGRVVTEEALGGTGFGLDLGGALAWGEAWVLGLSFLNVLGQIDWTDQAKVRTYEADLDSLNAQNADDFEVVDEVEDAEGFQSRIPPVLRVGISRRSGRITLTGDMEAGIGEGAGAPENPRFGVGIELRLPSWLRWRGGLSFADEGAGFGGGLGLCLGPLHVDLAVSSLGSFSPGNPRGLSVGLRTGLFF